MALYYPALSGDFIFDDYYSLSFLKHINDEINLKNTINYLSFADTGPLKRPISALSFLIDGQNWPTTPYPFKRTNLVIHLLNGVLLYFILLTILRGFTQEKQRAVLIITFSVAFWMMHPFLLSTTMYVVQRMAMLSTTFVFLGMLFYLMLRKKVESNPSNVIFLCMAMIFFSCSLLAVLSKENGILLLLFIPLLEKLIVQNYWGFSGLPKGWRWVLILLPVIAFVIIFTAMTPGFIQGYEDREFNMYERLLSQSRAVITYLYHYVTPYYLTEGVYTDGFTKSTGLLKPLSTVVSILGITALAAVAFVKKEKWPLFSFSVFFFFVAHVLESTIAPLELYFEHRNYLAFAFLAVPLVMFLMKKWSLVGMLVLGLFFSFTSFHTYLRASLWGNDFLMHKETMLAFPESTRARVLTANYYSSWGDYSNAEKVLKDGLTINNKLELKLNLMLIACEKHTFSDKQYALMNALLREERLIRNDLQVLGMIIAKILNTGCGLNLHLDKLSQILRSFKYSVDYNDSKGELLLNLSFGRYHFQQGDFDLSANYFLKAFDFNMDYENLIKTVSEFLKIGRPDLALKLVNFGIEAYAIDFKYKIDWKRYEQELLYFERIANEDIEGNK